MRIEKKITVNAESIYGKLPCPQCCEQMIPAQTSADFFGFSSRLIYRLIEADKIHFI